MRKNAVHLGVNVDHIATVRQARRGMVPSVVDAALLAQQGGADSITVHLREDRRHIQEQDVFELRSKISLPLNLEMAVDEAVVNLACLAKPDQATLVPEKREELTTEGGLDVCSGEKRIREVLKKLAEAGIRTSLFIDPDEIQIKAAREVGAACVELHTGEYANAESDMARQFELKRLHLAAKCVLESGMRLNAGHGLNYENVRPIASLPGLYELNIGHAIVARALMVGMCNATIEMKAQLI